MLYSACQMAQTLTKGRFNKFSLIYSINRCSFLFTANSALSGLFCRMFRSYSHLGRKRHSFRKINLPSSSMRSARLVRETTLLSRRPSTFNQTVSDKLRLFGKDNLYSLPKRNKKVGINYIFPKNRPIFAIENINLTHQESEYNGKNR